MRFALALVALFAACILSAGCGDDELTAEEVVDRTFDAIDEPGMVYHITADNGSQVWMDTENELFRREEPTDDGGLTSVGDGWVKTTYDPFNNVTDTQDESPDEALPPRIDNPAVQWLEPLTALAYARELELIGETSSVEGRRVIAVVGRSPVVAEDQATGENLLGRVEVDAETYEIVSFERRTEPAPGATPDPEDEVVRVLYETPEHIDSDELPDDFFDVSVVEGQIMTLEENIARMAEIGIDPYWLGETYDGAAALAVDPEQGGAIVDTEANEGSFHYGLLVPSGDNFAAYPESVVIKLGPTGTEFGPPEVQGFSGDTPEEDRDATARGVPARMYRSILTPSDLPCPSEPCAPSDVPLYYRLVFTLGETVVQIETSTRINQATGADLNVYNNDSGILELAEALFIAE